ncbi:MAG: phenylalanine--tRNA ligase subunit beta [Ignavibacteria bacterium]|nr:phenylalanine--tRNA ligase subunit beta [Ignavibacteria bacterium]
MPARPLDPPFGRTGSARGDVPLSILVEDPDLCPHYIGHVVTNVRPIESPQWLKDRLTSLGLRPRNVIVDVTNYVNMEMGQPLHAFDANKISDNTIVVRRAKATETTFVTLDGKERTLTPSMLMICDGQRPAAIAGVMGGQNTEVDDSTTAVVIESAYFDPSSIRRTAKSHGLSTDASYRFERGVDPAGVRTAADRAVQLLCELAGGSPGPRIEVGAPPPEREPISVSYDRIRSLVGITVDDETITRMLVGVGCLPVMPSEACPAEGRVEARFIPPTWRADITIEADLAEEVMRLYGIDNIPSSTMAYVALDTARMPSHLRAGGAHGRRLRDQVRTMLVARGYYDCVTNVLTGPDEGADQVTLKNALGRDFSALRSSVIPSLLRVASRNLRHGQQTVRLMEIGSQFTKNTNTEFGVQQQEVLTLMLVGQTDPHWSDKPRTLDLYDLVGELHVLAPKIESIPIDVSIRETGEAGPRPYFTDNVVELRLGGVVIGYAGEVSPELAMKHDIERTVSAAVIDLRAVPIVQPKYRAVGQFPSVRRDLALIVQDDLSAGRIIDVVRTASPLLLRDVGVFDVYRDKAMGEGMKSIGIGMTFRSDERTLVDADVDSAVESIINAAKQALGARVRGETVE